MAVPPFYSELTLMPGMWKTLRKHAKKVVMYGRKCQKVICVGPARSPGKLSAIRGRQKVPAIWICLVRGEKQGIFGVPNLVLVRLLATEHSVICLRLYLFFEPLTTFWQCFSFLFFFFFFHWGKSFMLWAWKCIYIDNDKWFYYFFFFLTFIIPFYQKRLSSMQQLNEIDSKFSVR